MFGGTKKDEDRYKGGGFKKVKVEEVEEKKWAPPPRDREEGEDLGRDDRGGEFQLADTELPARARQDGQQAPDRVRQGR